MKLFQLLEAIDPDVTPGRCKVHLHVPVEGINPLLCYRDGSFDEFQGIQSANIYKRPYTVALIRNQRGAYLFAGVFSIHGHERTETGKFRYTMKAVPAFQNLAGRLNVRYAGKLTQQPCYYGETKADDLEVHEVTAEPLGFGEFPGYKQVRLAKPELDLLMRTEESSWKTALSKVKGIYLITDTSSGALYVGKASGADGFWGRWSCYARTGHGGNAKMRNLLDRLSGGHAENFSFAILEIVDLHTSDAELDERETHWKQVLMSREGLNAN